MVIPYPPAHYRVQKKSAIQVFEMEVHIKAESP